MNFLNKFYKPTYFSLNVLRQNLGFKWANPKVSDVALSQ